MSEEFEHEEKDNWKIKTIIGGTLAGALIGLGAAFLLSRNAEKEGDNFPEISIGEALGVGISIIGIVRAIASLGERN
ncbi:MAG: hypothetical protein GY796_04475 [Chloroflexi bacterium]|nr:hypothetical protein [Chloroflexota bacterium]